MRKYTMPLLIKIFLKKKENQSKRVTIERAREIEEDKNRGQLIGYNG